MDVKQVWFTMVESEKKITTLEKQKLAMNLSPCIRVLLRKLTLHWNISIFTQEILHLHSWLDFPASHVRFRGVPLFTWQVWKTSTLQGPGVMTRNQTTQTRHGFWGDFLQNYQIWFPWFQGNSVIPDESHPTSKEVNGLHRHLRDQQL